MHHIFAVEELPAVGGRRQFQLRAPSGEVDGYVSEVGIPTGTALFCWGCALGKPELGANAFDCEAVRHVRLYGEAQETDGE